MLSSYSSYFKIAFDFFRKSILDLDSRRVAIQTTFPYLCKRLNIYGKTIKKTK
jgi:hypothetical protein